MVKGFQYVTFGKPARLGELVISALVLGGASQIGALPGGVTGEKGVFIVFTCVILIVWTGVKTGQRTLSPNLNRWPVAAFVSTLHIVYVSLALVVVHLLRGSPTDFVSLLHNHSIKVAALVGILTLGYIFTVNRTTELDSEARSAKTAIQSLSDKLSEYDDGRQIASQDVQAVIDEIKSVSDQIPESAFSDVNYLKNDLNDAYRVLDRLDPESAREIIVGEERDGEELTQQYVMAIKIYKNVKRSIDKI